jgi:hypothetical protein
VSPTRPRQDLSDDPSSTVATAHSAKTRYVKVLHLTFAFPAFCRNCGLIFPSSLTGTGAARLDLEHVITDCPRCGAVADLPDGTFDVVGDTIHVLSGSQLTRERMFRLAQILDAARAREMSEDEAVEAIADVAPPLAPLIDRLRPRMGQAMWIFLSAVVGVLLQYGFSALTDDSATKADVRRAVEDAVRVCLVQSQNEGQSRGPSPQP